MLNAFAQLNWLAILAASVLSFLLGGAWFAGVFRRPYAMALGREGQPAQKMAPLFLVGPFLCGVVTAVASALLMRMLGVTTLAGALQFGALVGAGYLAATSVNTAINPNIPRPLLYGLVSGGYFLLSTQLVCAVLVAL